MSNAGWVVGDGKTINIWNDLWLSYKEQQTPMGPAPESFQNLKVESLFLPHKTEWNREAINRILPFEERKVLMIKPSSTGAPDKLVWLGTSSGDSTTKSGYWTAMKRRSETAPEAHDLFDRNKNIWKLHTAPKIKLFLWKIMNQALPVGAQLAARNIGTATNCKRCNNVESISHLLFHCEYAQKVWSLAPYTRCLDSIGLVDFASCWTTLCDLVCLPPSGITTRPLAPWILWAIWTSRNNLFFNNKASTPEETMNRALAAAREWLVVQSVEDSVIRKTPKPPVQHPPNCIIIHSDAAWHADPFLQVLDGSSTKELTVAHT